MCAPWRQSAYFLIMRLLRSMRRRNGHRWWEQRPPTEGTPRLGRLRRRHWSVCTPFGPRGFGAHQLEEAARLAATGLVLAQEGQLGFIELLEPFVPRDGLQSIVRAVAVEVDAENPCCVSPARTTHGRGMPSARLRLSADRGVIGDCLRFARHPNTSPGGQDTHVSPSRLHQWRRLRATACEPAGAGPAPPPRTSARQNWKYGCLPVRGHATGADKAPSPRECNHRGAPAARRPSWCARGH